MGSRKYAAFAVAVALVAGCKDEVTPPAPPPAETSVTVLNLNAAMGFELKPGNADGTDATPEDIGLLADDVLKHPADVVHLQEMAVNAARDLRALLSERTGAEWQLNWAHSTVASYYEGKAENEEPIWRDVSAGNAQLIRIGAGIRSQRPITLDGEGLPNGEPDQGILLPTTKPDKGRRSFQGAEITTEHGKIDVYNTHLALERDFSDADRAKDVEALQRFTESRTNPAVITGDFNQVIDSMSIEPESPGELYPVPSRSPDTVFALTEFMKKYGYTDVAKDLGTTSNRQPNNELKKLFAARIDYILARGLKTRDTAKIKSHESDHWGLVTTIDPGSERVTAPPSPTVSAVPADRYRHELYSGTPFYFFTSADSTYLCAIVSDQAVCQGRTNPVPPAPPTCAREGGPSWGNGLFVDATGKVDFVCAGGIMYAPTDRAPDERDVLRPGTSFTALGYTCGAERTGIRCRQDVSGHGFFIAPDTNERF
ncbi:endonuclease/exonuclease/phosphatase family protein [Lentzea flaviverrucosa]|uniref:Metal-dependent hydrolase, endonuclease/exonuclease/phosphatase family n=1 Tax=Lentzea flaviverrucosa TaxID=200379 RepID=A0A1H9JMP7_9PSEU|nr:endonuclease/exonuclease/phosphatase family protein [Lentzea flaviverrucosa]RDI26560.1 endonuclease/exonuclease/phosphatase family metal-dependent hydrolase [Lentzea flaviverrucosa]SEQ87845.1 Metal-dependent hydrolase, endonuclease/exonuclease/phosphatase family [Lentzea flaviverrucosa]